MRYKDVEKINDEEFKRIVGVKKRIFFKMVEVYKKKISCNYSENIKIL
jgi:predicted DNA-binding protein (UPF0251 family)